MKKILYTLTICTICTVCLCLLTGCVFAVNTRYGNGQVETRTFDVKDFTKIELIGSMNADITQSDSYSVAVELDSNLFSYLNVYVKDETLIIAPKRNVNIWTYTQNITITMPRIYELETAGAVKASITGFNQPEASLDIDSAGACRITADVMVKDFRAETAGSCRIDLKGQAENLICSTAGNSSIYAFECKAAHVNASVAGMGHIEVYAEKKLKADIAGMGYIRYRGDPPIKKTSIVGFGSIKKG